MSLQEPDKLLDFEVDGNTILCGPSKSGKTHLMSAILEKGIFHGATPNRVIVCAPAESTETWKKEFAPNFKARFPGGVTYVEGLDATLDFIERINDVDDIENSVLVLDDFTEVIYSPKVAQQLNALFTVKTHHKHMWTFMLIHSIFAKGAEMLRRNTKDFILFNLLTDITNARRFVSTLIGLPNVNIFLDCWSECLKKNHGFVRYTRKEKFDPVVYALTGNDILYEDGAYLFTDEDTGRVYLFDNTSAVSLSEQPQPQQQQQEQQQENVA